MKHAYRDREGKPIELLHWARLWEIWAYRCVADDYIGDARVCTIWLGFDPYGPDPLDARCLFESTIFGGPLDQTQQHYATEDEARAGHAVLVERVRRA